MPFKRTLLREFEVAYSRKAQPLWFRLIKYVILGGLFICFWKSQLFLKIIAIIFILSLTVHFWVRYKQKLGLRVMVYGIMKKTNRSFRTKALK
jgi:hypothetical protein